MKQEPRAPTRIGQDVRRDELLMDDRHTEMGASNTSAICDPIDSSANEPADGPPDRGGRQTKAAACGTDRESFVARDYAQELRAPTRSEQERHTTENESIERKCEFA